MIWLASTIFVVAAAGVALYVIGVGVGSFFVMLEEGMQPKTLAERQYRHARYIAEQNGMYYTYLWFFIFCIVVAFILELISPTGFVG